MHKPLTKEQALLFAQAINRIKPQKIIITSITRKETNSNGQSSQKSITSRADDVGGND